MTSNPDGSTGASRLVVGVIFALAVLTAGVVGWYAGVRKQMQPLPLLGKAPQYTLTNQLGETVQARQFFGKIQIVTFLFPYCTTYCPLIAAHLVGFEHTLARAGLENKVQIIAFDVDPADTGPGQMRAFLKEYGWDPHDLHWQYLTGTPKQVRAAVTGGFHIAYQKVSKTAPPTAADKDKQDALNPQPTVVNRLADIAKPGYDITHNDGLEVVDGQGHIRKIYEDADVVSGQQLLAVIEQLLHTTGAS